MANLPIELDQVTGTVLTSSDDLNNVYGMGALGDYTWGPSSVPSNAPVASVGSVMHLLRYANASFTQVVYTNVAGVLPAIYIRSLSGTWSEWKRVGVTSVQYISIYLDASSSSTSKTINLPNNYRGMLVGIGSGESTSFEYLIRVSGTGGIQLNPIKTGSGVTISTASNKITVSLTSGTCNIYDVSFTGVPYL